MSNILNLRMKWQSDKKSVELHSLLDFLQTSNFGHTHGTLKEHLISTSNLLVDWGNHTTIVYAGLFHSIYGTTAYTTESLSRTERDVLKTAIGNLAEELVHLFSKISLRQLLDWSTRDLHSIKIEDAYLTPTQMFQLLEIHAANLVEQWPRLETPLRNFLSDRDSIDWLRNSSHLSSGARTELCKIFSWQR